MRRFLIPSVLLVALLAPIIMGQGYRRSGFVSQGLAISEYLRLTAGSLDGAVNGATGADTFFVQPPSGETWQIGSLTIYMEDNAAIDADTYGAIAALTNGIAIKVLADETLVVDLLDGEGIKTSAEFSQYAEVVRSTGNGTAFVEAYRINFRDQAGQMIELRGGDQGRLCVIVRDDLTTLVAHTFTAQGFNTSASF